MALKINERVTVGMVDATPKYILWHGRNHTVTKIGLHHYFRRGTTLYHVFSVLSGETFMRLKLDTDHLSWKLEEVSDDNC